MDTQNEVKHIRWEEVPAETLNPLFHRQFVVGDQIMVARILLKENCVVPMHSHHNEQLSQVLKGTLKFTIHDQEITVRSGEALCIPPHVPHAVTAIMDTIAVDIFTPPRKDWLDKTDQYLRG